ncbi:MAG TPA: hypothetical protein VKT78_18670 [Fimbriimonadaceae bacterium]|nr:hypothetical protein [Fimbriimonadaceae bacterium]
MDERTPAEKLERIAFAWCKVATAALILGPYVLPVAASLSAGLFIAAYVRGKGDTQCWFRHPLIAAGFWLGILAVWVWVWRTRGIVW